MRDIETRGDIEKLVAAFYRKALADEVIGYIFTDVAKIDLEKHLPVIADFWEMLLLRTINFQEKYRRSPMQTHAALFGKETPRREHFLRWLELFSETVDAGFAGATADLAKLRALSIANTMLYNFGRENGAATGRE